MMDFDVMGFTKGTKRRRHQIIAAKTESAAKAIANRRNIEVTSIQPVPQESASEAQLNYAFALGISCPPDATKEELSVLIQSHLDDAEDPLDLLVDLARKHRVAQITYWKYGEPRATVRLVEPYDLVGTTDEVRAVHCFQIHPHPADGNPWRTFNLVHIKSVLDTGDSFYPRRSGTLQTGELVTYESVNRLDISGRKLAEPKANSTPKMSLGTVLLFSVLIVIVLWIVAMMLKR